MVDAIISRGSTSVTVPLDVKDNSLAVARDVGKPNAAEGLVGAEAPRPEDQFNPQTNWTILGTLKGADAYADAKKLAEDLVLPQATDGTPLQVDLSALSGLSTYDVAPASDSALALTYDAGRTNLVGVEFSAVVVDATLSAENQTAFEANAAGSGSGVELSSSEGDSVVFPEAGLTLTRSCGRPNAKLQRQPADAGPLYVDQNRPASDTFKLRAAFTGSSAATDAGTLTDDIIMAHQGYDVYDLDFKGLFDLDSYPVFPFGSAPVRTARNAGEAGERVTVQRANFKKAVKYKPKQ